MSAPATEYLTAAEAAAYLRLKSVGSLYTFLYARRQRGFPVKTYRLNGRLRFTVEDLDAAMTVEHARPVRGRPSAARSATPAGAAVRPVSAAAPRPSADGDPTPRERAS